MAQPAPLPIPAPASRAGRAGALILIALAVVLTALYAQDVVYAGGHRALRAARHAEILAGTGRSPYGYRVLVPVLVEGLARLGEGAGQNLASARESAYFLVQLLATVAGLALFRAFLSARFAPGWAWAGVFLFAALHPASYRNYWFQPDSSPDLVTWLLALWLADRRAPAGWLVLLTAVGAGVRETALFAPFLWAAVALGHLPARRVAMALGASLAAWALVFGVLRWGIGPLPAVVTVSEVYAENARRPEAWALALAFYGLLWFLPVLRWREAPPELRRLALVGLPYLALSVLFGRIRELRLFLPLAVVLVPWGLRELGGAAACDPPGGDPPTRR